MNQVNLAIAFIAGLASFLSPCCLPLVPSYLAQLAGPGVLEAAHDTAHVSSAPGGGTAALARTVAQRATVWHAAAFVAGFSVVFIALGATASVLGGVLKTNQVLLGRLGGAVLILMGLHYIGIFRIALLDREGRSQWRPAQRGFPASFTIGVIYAFGWTPCIGPVLTGILVLAAQAGTLASGIGLLAAYALGLGVPYIILGFAFAQAYPLLRKLAPYVGTIERMTGIIMVVMGVVIFNGWLIYLNAWFYRMGIRGI